MSDQTPLSEDELAKKRAESGSDDQDQEDAPGELISDTPPGAAKKADKKPADRGSGGGDREMTQAEIDALLASLGDD